MNNAVHNAINTVINANRSKWEWVEILDNDQPEWIAEVASKLSAALPGVEKDLSTLTIVVEMAGKKHLAKNEKYAAYNKA